MLPPTMKPGDEIAYSLLAAPGLRPAAEWGELTLDNGTGASLPPEHTTGPVWSSPRRYLRIMRRTLELLAATHYTGDRDGNLDPTPLIRRIFRGSDRRGVQDQRHETRRKKPWRVACRQPSQRGNFALLVPWNRLRKIAPHSGRSPRHPRRAPSLHTPHILYQRY